MPDSFQFRSLLVIGEKPNTRQLFHFNNDPDDSSADKISITGNNGTGKSRLLADIQSHCQAPRKNSQPEIDTSKVTKLIASTIAVNGAIHHRVSIHGGENNLGVRTFTGSDELWEFLENSCASDTPLRECLDTLLSGEYAETPELIKLPDTLFYPDREGGETNLMSELSRQFASRRDQFLLFLAEKSTQEQTVAEAIADFRENTPNQLENLAASWNDALEETAGITFHTNTATFAHTADGTAADFNELSEAIQLFLTRTGLIFLTLSENNVPPFLILVDEPEAGLSPALTDSFISILNDLTQEKCTSLIFATKNPDITAAFPAEATFELELNSEGTRIVKTDPEPIPEDTIEIFEEDPSETSDDPDASDSPPPKKVNLAKLKRAIEATDDQDELANLVDELMSLRKL